MKRIIMIALFIGMFGWAVYDFVIKADSTASPDETKTEEEEEIIGIERGNIAPDFELKNLEGETVRLSDFRGKRVMLNFWATWCPPCRAEMPDMQKFYENKDVVILAVNLTETKMERNNVPGFVKDFGLTFPVLLDEDMEVSTLYRIQPIPTTYLIDSSGRIHNMAFGALNYDLMVQEFEKMK